MDQFAEYPAVNLNWGAETRGNETIAGNNPLLDLRLQVRIDVFMSEVNDIQSEVDKVIADVQQRFGTYYYIPESTGGQSAFNCLYLGSEPFGTDSTVPNCGVSIDLEVWYRINLDDPATMQ
jgi:hypothetical protein